MLLLRVSVFMPLWAGVSTSAAGCGLTPPPSPTGAGVTVLGRWSLVTLCHHQRWEHQLVPVSLSVSNLKKTPLIIDLPPDNMHIDDLHIFIVKVMLRQTHGGTIDIHNFMRPKVFYTISSTIQAFASGLYFTTVVSVNSETRTGRKLYLKLWVTKILIL